MGVCASSCKIKELEKNLEESFKKINNLENETDENFNYLKTKICAANMKITELEFKNRRLEKIVMKITN